MANAYSTRFLNHYGRLFPPQKQYGPLHDGFGMPLRMFPAFNDGAGHTLRSDGAGHTLCSVGAGHTFGNDSHFLQPPAPQPVAGQIVGSDLPHAAAAISAVTAAQRP